MCYDAVELEYITVACDRFCKVSHWLVFICTSLLGLVRPYLCIYVYKNINGIACTLPALHKHLSPESELGKKKKLLNVLQNELKGRDRSFYNMRFQQNSYLVCNHNTYINYCLNVIVAAFLVFC